VFAENHGSCIHQNKYPVQDDEYNYHDSLQVHLREGTGHSRLNLGSESLKKSLHVTAQTFYRPCTTINKRKTTLQATFNSQC